MRMSRLLVAAIVVMSMVFVMPAFSADTKVVDTEINIGGGHPLWGTHTDNDNTHFDGMDSWLFFASVDKKKKDSKWLKYGLMYNYTRIKMGVETETTHKREWDRCWDSIRECAPIYDVAPVDNPGFETYTYTTTSESHDWLNVHVLGPYAKPYFKIGKRISIFGMVGAGLMYVDGKIYGDELGGAGFASAGLSVDIYKNFGIAGQMLYVKGFTKHVEDIDYYAPVLSLNYRF